MLRSQRDKVRERELTCPTTGTAALVLLVGKERARPPIATGVVRVAGGVFLDLAVGADEAQRTNAAGASRNSRQTHSALSCIQTIPHVTRVSVLAVLA